MSLCEICSFALRMNVSAFEMDICESESTGWLAMVNGDRSQPGILPREYQYDGYRRNK
jgi:hypothetical protein